MDVLINWLWQAVTFVALVGLAVKPWRGMSAAMRHAVWGIALTLVLIMPLRAWLTVGPASPAAAVAALDEASAPGASAFARPALPAFPTWVVLAVICLWLEWVAFSAVRLARAVVALAEARRACQPFPAERAARLPLWQRLSAEGRSATLALSSRVSGAAVLGVRRPIIAISPALLRGLTDEELDQVVVHELAHVRRRDDIAAFALALVDVVAGFHPAVRVAQVHLHIDREMACDDWVVRATGSARRYAACLTRVAAMQQPRLSLLAPGALAPSQLTLRVTHLLDRRRSRGRATIIGMTLAAALLAVLTAALGELALEAARPAAIRTSTAAWSALRLESESTAAATVSSVVADGGRRPRLPATSPTVGEPQPAPTALRAPARSPERATPVPPAPSTVGGEQTPPQVLEAASPAPLKAYPLPVTADAAVEEAGGGPLSSLPWRAPATAGMALGQGTATAGVTAAQTAADAGLAIGQGSQKAATATAGFFSRMGKSFGRVF